MDTQDIISRQKKVKKKRPERSLFKEYIHYWYILLLTVITCFPGYIAEIIIFNFMALGAMPAFMAGFLAILLGGLISTFPFFILNLVLFFKRKKRYAAVCQIVVMEFIGMIFFLYNQVVLTMV